MAICGIDGVKIPMMDNKRRLKTGELICNRHWKEAGLGFTDIPKDLTLGDIKARLNAIDRGAEKLGVPELSKSDKKTLAYLSSKHLESLDSNSLKSIEHISNQLTGSGLTQAGIALSFSGTAADRLSLNFQNALVEQNWIIMRQNQQIIDLLKENNKND